METAALIISAAACLLSLITLIAVLTRKNGGDEVRHLLDERAERDANRLKAELDSAKNTLITSQGENTRSLSETQNAALETLRKTVNDMSGSLEGQFRALTESNEKKLTELRDANKKSIDEMKAANEQRLNEIKTVVDEKLQKTLNERFTESFKTVAERLEAVSKGLGEMQSLASNVGDLKNVLTNVKTRGGMGEIQLESILSELLPRELWEKQYQLLPGRGERVDFAVKLPGTGAEPVWLPVDAKFPLEDYRRLTDANAAGDRAASEAARKALFDAIKRQAKSIHDKYISVPVTTEFAIMYLPSEGLYAEAAQSDIMDNLRREYRVNLAGPSTVAAFLNSLQMGFRTLEIQKRSAEVWKILGAVKTEFEKFGSVLSETQKSLTKAGENLDKLVGTRSRLISSKLKSITTEISPGDAETILGDSRQEQLPGPDGAEAAE